MPLTKELVEKYKKDIFIETGTWKGDAIQLALDAGIEKVYSIEANWNNFEETYMSIYYNGSVMLLYGDSTYILPVLLGSQFIDKPVLFWLDAHLSANSLPVGTEPYPLLKELEIIENQGIMSHTIMIDDIGGSIGTDIENIKNLLLEINPMYSFSYEDAGKILVAHI